MGATRLQLRTRARVRADQDASTFPTDAQYDLLIDEAAKDVFYDLIQAGWPAETEDLSVTLTGAGSYSLGTPRTMASFTPAWQVQGPVGTDVGTIEWLDDGTDPVLKHGYSVVYTNGDGPSPVTCTVNDTAGTVTLNFETGWSPGIYLSDIKAAIEATGVLTTVGWVTVGAYIPMGFEPSPGNQGTFSGAAAGSDQVFSVQGVFRKDGSALTELPRIQEGERASLASSSGSAAAYDLVGNQSMAKIRVYPPTATGQLLVKLVREYQGLPKDSSHWNGPVRSDELVVLMAAMKACRKEGNDQGAALLEREYAALRDKVQNMAGWLHGRHSALVRDVQPDWARRDPFDYDV